MLLKYNAAMMYANVEIVSVHLLKDEIAANTNRGDQRNEITYIILVMKKNYTEQFPMKVLKHAAPVIVSKGSQMECRHT